MVISERTVHAEADLVQFDWPIIICGSPLVVLELELLGCFPSGSLVVCSWILQEEMEVANCSKFNVSKVESVIG